MNKWISGVLVAGLVAGLTASAHAQDAGGSMKVAKPFSVKIGGIFFSDGDVKDAIGNSTITLGVGYDFLKTKAENPVVLQGYLDFLLPKERTDSFDTGEGTLERESKLNHSIGVGVAARYQLVRATETTSVFPYAGLGLGIYNSKMTSSFDGDSDSSTKTGLGGKIFVGAELKQGFIGEIEYNFIPGDGGNLNGFGARIGYRF
jgi:hypothetical protein